MEIYSSKLTKTKWLQTLKDHNLTKRPQVHNRQPLSKLAWTYAGKELYLFSFNNAPDVRISLLFLSTMRVWYSGLCNGGRAALKWKGRC